jgi:uncharacterized membrane protein
MYSTIIKYVTVIGTLALTTSVQAHELTPTYPQLQPSFISGISKVDLVLFNRRQDIKYYEITVHDAEWNNLEFAATSKIVELDYLKRKNLEVFMNIGDGKSPPVYICTTSKIAKEDITATVIESRVCSKIK